MFHFVIPRQSRATCFLFFQRAIPIAHRHVDRAHFDAMAPRIGHQLRRRVETHRLRIEQRTAKSRRLIVLEPFLYVETRATGRSFKFIVANNSCTWVFYRKGNELVEQRFFLDRCSCITQIA